MRPNPVLFSFLLLGCLDDDGLRTMEASSGARTRVHAAAFRVDCTDEICDAVVAVPLGIPDGAYAHWVLDGEQLEVEPSLPLHLDSGEMVELSLEVQHEGQLFEDTQWIARSDLVDGEGNPLGTGHLVTGVVDPIDPNVVTFGDCDDKMVKVAIIGGCFSANAPFDVLITQPMPSRPRSLADYGTPAHFEPTPHAYDPFEVTLGDWSASRLQVGQYLHGQNATWPHLMQGDRLELAAPASGMPRWLLIQANGMVHENPVKVACEDGSFAVELDTLLDKSKWVGN